MVHPRVADRHWRGVLRAGDTIARFGGDEFVILLPACALRDAEAILERLRAATPGGVTCSIGSAGLQPGTAPLYDAKRLGRNQVAWAA